MNITRLLDDATRDQVVSEMGKRDFSDTASALRHLAYSVRSGKRFSLNDVVAILGEAGLETDGVSTALAELVETRALESYPKGDTIAYYMERGARIEYGESIGRKSRASGWCFCGAAQADS